MSESRVERLPFTVYDILGYFVPGSFMTWVFVSYIHPNDLVKLSDLINNDIIENSIINQSLSIFIFFVISFLVGHIIAFLSSITVEKLVICYFGYPSKTLLVDQKIKGPIKHRTAIRNIIDNIKNARVVIIHIFMFPLVPVVWFLILTGWHSIVIKTLPNSIAKMIQDKFEKVTEYSIDPETSEKNWFIYICYYVINNNASASFRMYNYVTVYGFLRSFCFIFVVFSFISFKNSFYSLYHIYYYGIFIYNYDADYLKVFFIFMIISSMLFCAFIKFYRRYSEEAMMAFITKSAD